MRRCDALSCTDTVIHQAYPPTGLYYAIIGQIRQISLYTSKTPGQSGSPGQSRSRVTGVPGRVGSRVSATDPVPSLPPNITYSYA